MAYKTRPIKVDDSTTVRTFFPSRFISADDLKGKDHTLVIDHFVEEEFPTKKDPNAWVKVMYFKGARKGIKLTPTIMNSVEELWGHHILGWIGKPITLYGTIENSFGKDWAVVRVRDKRPATNAPAGPVAEALNQVEEDEPDEPSEPPEEFTAALEGNVGKDEPEEEPVAGTATPSRFPPRRQQKPEAPTAPIAPDAAREEVADLTKKYRYNELPLVTFVADKLRITRGDVLNALHELVIKDKKLPEQITISEALAALKGKE